MSNRDYKILFVLLNGSLFGRSVNETYTPVTKSERKHYELALQKHSELEHMFDIDLNGWRPDPKDDYDGKVDLSGEYQELLHFATIYNCPHVIKYLHGIGHNVNRKVNEESPLHLAAQDGYSDCVNVLLSAKADPSILNDDGESAYDYAKKWNHPEIVSILSRYNSGS